MSEDNLLTEMLEPNEIPAKFKDVDGRLKVKTMLQSYQALERKMSSHAGAPAKPEEYCIDCSHGYFEPDQKVNQRLHAKGLSNEQMQEVYDLAAEIMVPMIQSIAADFQADRDMEQLIDHFGGKDKWKEVARQLLAYGRQNLSPQMLEHLAGSYEGSWRFIR